MLGNVWFADTRGVKSVWAVAWSHKGKIQQVMYNEECMVCHWESGDEKTIKWYREWKLRVPSLLA